MAFVLVATLMWLAWQNPVKFDVTRPVVLQSAGIFLGTDLLVWPAALLKLVLVKSYLFMAYLAVSWRSAWGDVTFLKTWLNRFYAAPLRWALIGAMVFVWCTRRGEEETGFW